jgi:hypothetical protein
MKFMVSYRIHEDKRHEVLKAFSQMTAKNDQADMGERVKLIGRWHDLASFTGVAIVESDDAQAIASWALNWNSSLDIEVAPVLDDEEAREVGRKQFK